MEQYRSNWAVRVQNQLEFRQEYPADVAILKHIIRECGRPHALTPGSRVDYDELKDCFIRKGKVFELVGDSN